MQDNSKISITGFLGLKKLISVNHMYTNVKHNPNIKTLTSEAREAKRLLTSSLRDSGVQSGCLKGTDMVFKLTVISYFSRNYYGRDTDNPYKLIQDVITNYVGFDDSRVVEMSVTKKLARNKDHLEFIYYKLESLENFEIEVSYESIQELFKTKGC